MNPRILIAASCLIAAVAMPSRAQQAPQRRWVGTWAASPQSAATSGPPSVAVVRDQTIREVVRVSMGGDTLRIRLSNEFGSAPLVIGAARIALSAGGGAIQPGTTRVLTFGGDSSVRIPPRAPALSDPVVLRVPPLTDLVISLYVPDSTPTATYHELARATSWVSQRGNHTADLTIAPETTATNWYFLSGLSVRAPAGAAAIVTLGNSITDGYGATVDSNTRWPNVLAQRLAGARVLDRLAVLNEGISGNRVLHDVAGPSALARLDRDVLRQPGVRFVIVLEGINDIGWSAIPGFRDQDVSAAEIIAGHAQIIARAHELGLTIYGATLTPFEGARYYTEAGETKRAAVNAWIRSSGAYDGVIDFDSVTRDPDHPGRFLPAFDCGDHLHPNDAGYRAMGEAIKLELFGIRGRR